MVTVTNASDTPLRLSDGKIIAPNQTLKLERMHPVPEKLELNGRTIDWELPRFTPPSLSGGAFAVTGREFLDTAPLVVEARRQLDVAGVAAVQALDLAAAIHGDLSQTPVARHMNAKARTWVAIEKPWMELSKVCDALSKATSKLENDVTPGEPAPVQAILTNATVAALLGMKPYQRRERIIAALKVGDVRLLPVLFHLPALASGLDDTEQEGFRLQWQHDHHGTEMAFISEFKRVSVWTNKGVGLLYNFHRSLFAPVAADIGTKARQRAEAA